MLKILRKHNKIILVVGGTLLLVAFLIPQAIQQVGRAKLGKSVGAMDGHKITMARWDQSFRELAALRSFFQNFRSDLPIALDDGHEAEHWLLLTTEAQNAGMVGGANEGASLLPIMAEESVRAMYQQQYRQYAEYVIQSQPDQFREAVTSMHQQMAAARAKGAMDGRMSPEEFDVALASMRGVFRMLDSYSNAERLSAQQAVAMAKERADSVLVDAAFLPARRLADEALTPTPEDLQAQFERFKELRPGEGDFGIGYRLPPRVKLEWIELSRPAIEGAIKISLIDVTKHYQQNRDRFPGPLETEREKVEAELRKDKADRVLEAAGAVIRAEVATALRPLERDGDYRKLPDNWAALRPDLVKLADKVVASVQESEGVAIPTPAVTVRDAGWLDGAMLSKLPGIGAAQVRFGQQTITFPQAAMSVRELAGDSVLLTQVGVTPLDLSADGRDGSRYFYNVLAAAAESVPASIDEVLNPEALTTDWRAIKQYEVLAASAPEFATRAAAEGLEGFATSFGEFTPKELPLGETELKPQPRVVVAKNARVLQDRTTGLGSAAENSPEVITDVRARGEAIDPMTPIDSVPLTDRVVVTALPKKLGVLVMQINGVEPLTRESLPTWADYAVRLHHQEAFRGVGVPFPYRFEALRQRHAFALKTREGDEEKPDADQS